MSIEMGEDGYGPVGAIDGDIDIDSFEVSLYNV